MIRVRVGAVLVTVAAVVGAAGCGTGSSSNQISKQAADDLRPLVQALRVAADGTSLPAVVAAEKALIDEVTKLEMSTVLTTDQGTSIQEAAEVLLTAYQAHNSPSASPSITPSTTPPATPTDVPTTPVATATITKTVGPATSPPVTPSTTPPVTPSITPTTTKTPHH